MILIKNTQRTIPLNLTNIRKDVALVLRKLGYEDFDIGIWFTTNTTIQRYNNTFRHKNKPTDILSFPFYPDLKAGEAIKAKTADEKNLGDLIISPAYVRDDTPAYDVTFEERLQHVLVHGICHLLGYDHIHDEDYAAMHTLELKLLKKLKTTQ